MRRVIGSVLVTIIMASGAYVALILCFVDGIVQIINGVKTTPANGGDIGWGLARVFVLPESAGFLTFFIVAVIGRIFLNWDGRKPRKFREARKSYGSW